jgi:hypothetical protein
MRADRHCCRIPRACHRSVMLTRLLLFASLTCCAAADGLMDEITVECHPHEMKVRLTTSIPFHGLVYPRGLDKKSPCMAEYDVQQGAPFTYTVPLRSCNTMFTDSVLIAFLFIFHRPDDDRAGRKQFTDTCTSHFVDFCSRCLTCGRSRRTDTSNISTRSSFNRTGNW